MEEGLGIFQGAKGGHGNDFASLDSMINLHSQQLHLTVSKVLPYYILNLNPPLLNLFSRIIPNDGTQLVPLLVCAAVP